MPIINSDMPRTQYAEEWRLTQALHSMTKENERLRRELHHSSVKSSFGNKRSRATALNNTIENLKPKQDALLCENASLQQENMRLQEMMEVGRVKFEELVNEYNFLDKAMLQLQVDYDELKHYKITEGSMDIQKSKLVNIGCKTPTSNNDDKEMLRSVHAHLQPIKKLLECPVCLDYMEDTHVSPDCLHRFCGNCIKASLRKCKHECPSCRVHIPSKRGLRADREFDDIAKKITKVLALFEANDSSSFPLDFIIGNCRRTLKNESNELSNNITPSLYSSVNKEQMIESPNILKRKLVLEDEMDSLRNRKDEFVVQSTKGPSICIYR